MKRNAAIFLCKRPKLWLLAVSLCLIMAGTEEAIASNQALPAYGGQMFETPDGMRVEFAIRDKAIRVWLRDRADTPIPATRISGKVILLAGSQKLDLPLHGQNTLNNQNDYLSAEGDIDQSRKLTAILSLTVDGKPIAARFQQADLQQPSTLSAPAVAGQKAFQSLCASCHSPSLRGTDQGPPLLHAYYALGAGHGDEMLLNSIANGTASHHWKFGDMPKPAGLNPNQEKELLAYIREMQAANGIGPLPAQTPPAPMPPMSPHSGHH